MKVNVGPFAPPIGGVSTYLSRAAAVLHERVIPSNRGYLRLAKELLPLRNATIYMHDMSKYSMYSVCAKFLLCRLGCKLCIVNHNYIVFEDVYVLRFHRRYLFSKLLSWADCVYHVNSDILNKFQSNYQQPLSELFDPFISPTISGENILSEYYSKITVRFINSCDILVVAGACRLNFHNGVDLYGLDMLIELVKFLKTKTSMRIGLLFGLPDAEYNLDYYHFCLRLIQDYGLHDSISFLTDNQELWPAMQRADLFIRPTVTDGNPLSIQEALQFGVPVIASDCTVRDERVDTFESRNQTSLNMAAMKVLKL